MTTIKDVAKKAGVGVSTVSRYLNDGYVSDKSAGKIEKAMNDLNYYPNAAARSIKSKKSNTVALLIPSISNAFFPELAEYIEKTLNERGYKMILCNVNEDREREEKYIDMILTNRIDGVISSTGFISERLIESGLPIISTDRMDIKNTQVVCVTADHYGGAVKATKHLIDTGCKRIVHLHGSFDAETAVLRHKAFVDTCVQYGIHYESIPVKSEYDVEYISTFDGVFVWADIEAIRFMNKCFAKNIRIPEDLQVVGFDDIALSKLVYPQLTTVSQPITELAHLGANMLIDVIEKKATSFENVLLDTDLKIRKTTKGENQMNIVVVGSINTDMVTETDRFPKIGETITGNKFNMLFGGKGANQAVCASRLGANVTMIGCVGDDANGRAAIQNLQDNRVNTGCIEKIDQTSTGIAQITVAEEDNTIIIVKGANEHVSKEMIERNKRVLESADLVLLQLEIPMETVEYVVELCAELGVKTVLNPAPAMPLKQSVLDQASYIIPNETECAVLFGDNYEETLQQYPNKLIVTQGAGGVDYYLDNEIHNVAAHKVPVVDTTGAGDSFNGAFSVGIVSGKSIGEAIEFGNKVASVTIQKLGAQTSMPYKEDLS